MLADLKRIVAIDVFWATSTSSLVFTHPSWWYSRASRMFPLNTTS